MPTSTALFDHAIPWQAPSRALEGFDYKTRVKEMEKVLDFDQLGGPDLTVDSTVFEMWMCL